MRLDKFQDFHEVEVLQRISVYACPARQIRPVSRMRIFECDQHRHPTQKKQDRHFAKEVPPVREKDFLEGEDLDAQRYHNLLENKINFEELNH